MEIPCFYSLFLLSTSSNHSKSFFFPLVISYFFFLIIFLVSFHLHYSLFFCHWFCCCCWGVFLLLWILFSVLFCSVSTFTTVFKTCWGLSLSDSQMVGRMHQRMGQQQSRTKYNRRAHINCIRGIPRVSSSGNQGDCITESHGLLSHEATPRRQGVKADLSN